MKDSNIKKEFFPFDYTDLTALEERLTERAAQGWMLVSMRGRLTYERCAPCSMRFNADILPMADKNTNIINEESRAYIDFCEDTGWHFISNLGVVYVFCTDDPSLPDINTDSEEKVALISKSCRRNVGLLWFITAALLLNCGVLAFEMLIPTNRGIVFVAAMAGIVIICSVIVLITAILKTIGYVKWKKSAEAAMAESRPIPYNSIETLEKRRRRLIAFWIMMAILLLVPIAFAASKGSDESLIVAAAALIIGISTGLFAVYISKKELSVGKQVLFILLFMLGVSIAAVVTIVFVGSLLGIISEA